MTYRKSFQKKVDGIIVDKADTNAYRDVYTEQCECVACEIYRMEFEDQYFEVVSFLQEFGVNIYYPLSTMDVSDDEKEYMHEYIAYYCVRGELPTDKIEMKIGNINVTMRNWNIADEAYANTGMLAPYFIIELDGIIIYGHNK